MSQTLSTERLAAAGADMEAKKEPKEIDPSYQQMIQQARRDYAESLPPFILSKADPGARREIILANDSGEFPIHPSSFEVIRARRWDYTGRHCFWTLDYGGRRLILAPRGGGGRSAGCRYLRWLGKGQGIDGFSERAHAYSMPTAKILALYPQFGVRSNIGPLPAAPPTTIPDHRRYVGGVTRVENSIDGLRSGSRGPPNPVASGTPTEDRRLSEHSTVSPLGAKRKARPANALAKGRKPTRSSELPPLLEPIHHDNRTRLLQPIRHENPTRLYAESSSGSEYEDSVRDDTGVDGSSPEPSTPRPAKKSRTTLVQNDGGPARTRIGLATPESMLAVRTLSPSEQSLVHRSMSSPYPSVGERSVTKLKRSNVGPGPKTAVATASEPQPTVPRARKRPIPTIQTRSVSRIPAASGHRASRARSRPKEPTPGSPEIPLSSPFDPEPAAKEEIVISDTESVMFCGSAEVQARPEVPDSRPASRKESLSSKSMVEKQELAVSSCPIRSRKEGAS
ncbi:MAG: hypothetical protein Q9168_000163 [Polycauliona sp. 1 TL-2023]